MPPCTLRSASEVAAGKNWQLLAEQAGAFAPEAVAVADEEAARDLAGLLPGTQYFWRVDEVEMDGVTVHQGDVWSFVSQALTAYWPDPVDGATTPSTTKRGAAGSPPVAKGL